MTFETPFLLGAGFLGGVLNAIAGGGSFVTFPALLMAGISPISANATNTLASCAGYLSGAFAFRGDIHAHGEELPALLPISLIGGMAGAWLLLRTSEASFREAIPWLLLAATLLLAFADRLKDFSKRIALRHPHVSPPGHLLQRTMLLGICIYGGFFNAGLGILLLSHLALTGHSNINAMNGLKLLISSAVSLTAIALFVWDGAIAWREGALVLLGTLVGGYAAAHVSRKLPQTLVRTLVLIVSLSITAHFFFLTYVS